MIPKWICDEVLTVLIIAAANRAITTALAPGLNGSNDGSDIAEAAEDDARGNVGSMPLLPDVERGSNEFFRPGWRPQAAMSVLEITLIFSILENSSSNNNYR